MSKVELVQASINLSNGVIIYTFKMKYPRKHWNNHFGYHIGQTTRVETTCIGNPYKSFKEIRKECDPKDLNEIIKGIHTLSTFAAKVLTAIANKRTVGRITSADVKKAQALFGSRVQDVLKQYNIGEWHKPFPDNPKHNFIATEKGWSLHQ